MTAVLLPSLLATVAGGLLMLAAGVAHTRHPSSTVAAVRRHGVLGPGLARAVGTGLGVAEIVLAVAVLAAVLTWAYLPAAPSPNASGVAHVAWTAARAAAAGTTGVYAAFTGYLLVVLRRAPGAPCACFGGDEPVTWATPTRSGILALACVPAAFCGDAPSAADVLGTSGGTVLIGAGVLTAGLAWAIPAVVALVSADPEGGQHRGAVREQ